MASPFIEAQAAIDMFDARLDQLRGIVDEFPEDKLWQRPRPDMVSLGNLVCHVAGSMRAWLENGLGAGDWQRNRDKEFGRQEGPDRRELLEHLNQTRRHCDTFLSQVNASVWEEPRRFRGKTFTVREVIFHQVEHIAYHAGQAAFLRRIVADLPAAP